MAPFQIDAIEFEKHTLNMTADDVDRIMVHDRRWFAANPSRRYRCRKPLRNEVPAYWLDHRLVIIVKAVTRAADGQGVRLRTPYSLGTFIPMPKTDETCDDIFERGLYFLTEDDHRRLARPCNNV